MERIYFPVKVLGPGNRVGIWLKGCDKKCDGCISPEMQIYDKLKEIDIDDLICMILSIPNKIEGITISGGEPFFNPQALFELVSRLNDISDDILIFSGYTYEELKSQNDIYINQVLSLISAIVDGSFIRELHTDIGLKGSSNQKIMVFKNHDRYENVDVEKRELQIVVANERVITLGIP